MTLEYRRSTLPLHSLKVIRIFWIKLFNLPQSYLNQQAFKSTAKKTGLVFAQIQQLKVPQKVFTQRRLHHSNLQQAWNSYALSICTWFLKNQVGKIKFDKLDFFTLFEMPLFLCLCSLQKSISKLIFAG